MGSYKAPGMTDSSDTDNPGINDKGPQIIPSVVHTTEVDGSCAPLSGPNPGRDQDRSRMDERIGSTYR